jgi:excisionase family DNA binding protein
MSNTTSLRQLFDQADNPRTLTAGERRAIATAEYLTAHEAAILLRTSPTIIYRKIKDGTLPTIHLGPRFIRILRADVDALRRMGEAS